MTDAPSRLRSVAKRYRLLAPIYELFILGPVLFGRARARAISLLRLRDGHTVLDVACGTGLNLPALRAAVGDRGRVICLDYTEHMLDRARRTAQRAGWTNITFLRMDAATLTPRALHEAGALADGEQVDAVICTLGLSVIPAWEQAYAAMLHIVRPGGRIAIMDTDYPAHAGHSGELVLIRPIAKLANQLAGAPGGRQPWLQLRHDTDEAEIESSVGGYVGVAAGTAPHRPRHRPRHPQAGHRCGSR